MKRKCWELQAVSVLRIVRLGGRRRGTTLVLFPSRQTTQVSPGFPGQPQLDS